MDPLETEEMYEGFNTINPTTNKTLDSDFKRMLTELLISGKLKKKYIIELLSNENVIQEYHRVFTHKSYDPINNYEFYEFLGDGTANNCVIWYLGRNFNEYNLTPKPQEPLSRAKITLISTQGFSENAKKMGFWKFIRASLYIRRTMMKKILEDTFEAFIGATQLLIDQYIGSPQNVPFGAGYTICYNIISALLDENELIKKFVQRRSEGLPAIDYFEVCDAVTRLKQTMEAPELMAKGIGRIVPNPRIKNIPPTHKKFEKEDFEVDRSPVTIDGHEYTKVSIEFWLQRGHFTGPKKSPTWIPDNTKPIVQIGQGEAFDRDKAYSNACIPSLHSLSRLGLAKGIPESYLATATR